MSQNVNHPVVFSLLYLLVLLQFSLSLMTLSIHLILSILLLIHISEASVLHSSAIFTVHVSVVYSTTLHTKHFIILFFSPTFSIRVNNFFLSRNGIPTFHLSSASDILFTNIHLLISDCLNTRTVSFVQLIVHLCYFIFSFLTYA